MEETDFWLQILRRLDQGENQASIAQSLGWTRGQFRYRLRRFRESYQGPLEAAAGPETISSLERKHVRFWMDEYWTREGLPNRVVLMVKDPWTVFAYWTVAQWRKDMVSRHFEKSWSHLPLFLRLHDVTDLIFDGEHAHSRWEIPIHPDADHWYFRNVTAGRRYLLDFGTYTDEGFFFTILRSNVAGTPSRDVHVAFQRFGPVTALHAGSKERSGYYQVVSKEPKWANRFTGYSLVEEGEEK